MAPDAPTLPDDVVAEAERLTRLARRAADPAERAAYEDRRADLLAAHGFEARIREADDALVCYPAGWLDDAGVVRLDRVEDTGRAVEIPLSGPGDPEEWEAVEADNAALVSAVRDAADENAAAHAANARAFADFMSNHYAKRIERATPAEVEEFLAEYYPRNAWPNDRQRELIRASLRLVFEVAGVDPPPVPTGDGERGR
ncbi:MAG: rnhA operon protein [Haloferacaceae archaeon]